MKLAFMILFSNLASLACVVGAFQLAMADRSGWGWFLLVAVLLTKSFSYKKSDDVEGIE